ncbi:GNAT family N-acetyltransferase [Sphingorhabdus contaminans]|jgi:GNAT superfamily N-acetyltransferase|uniref:GNAT family N-acetyltransferase n=1 Tax=Sphingorhabdus contaminans TaxID=1343899 RepID=A0A553WHJ1_9SPHN|nr:GNAT family N-acetyltransferase [Sphingorhabdus contaminans]TSB04161.1 GNAT family N-acetyltransferase [Sphingorhabdus contaminans]
MSFTPIAKGEVGAIVTSLEMRSRPSLRPLPSSDLRLERWPNPTANKYRALFRRVGEPWLWFSRLTLDDADLLRIIQDPQVRIWAVTDRSGVELGIVELDFRVAGECEIAFFGLVPELAGMGYGKWLMAMTLQFAWSEPGMERLWVHTCTLDAPGALNFYIKSGFTPYQRQVETFADPRLIGLIPPNAAPQIPLIT